MIRQRLLIGLVALGVVAAGWRLASTDRPRPSNVPPLVPDGEVVRLEAAARPRHLASHPGEVWRLLQADWFRPYDVVLVMTGPRGGEVHAVDANGNRVPAGDELEMGAIERAPGGRLRVTVTRYNQHHASHTIRPSGFATTVELDPRAGHGAAVKHEHVPAIVDDP